MKNCVGIADLLCAYADNELNESNKLIVEDHLSICENCSAILGIYREISVSVSETNVPAPEALRIGVMNRIQSEDVPRRIDNNKQRRQYKYILTRFAPIAACLVVGLVVWQFWGTLWGNDNTASPATIAPAPMAAAPAPAAAAPEIAIQMDDSAAVPEAEYSNEAADAFGINISPEEPESAPAPGDRMEPAGSGAGGFLERLYESIDGFGPLDGVDARLFAGASAVITVIGDLPVALAEYTPEPDWMYGRFGWETLYVTSGQMIPTLLDEVGNREGTTVVYNNNNVAGDYVIILLSYGL